MTIPNMKVNKLRKGGYNNSPTLRSQFLQQPQTELTKPLWLQIATEIRSADYSIILTSAEKIRELTWTPDFPQASLLF